MTYTDFWDEAHRAAQTEPHAAPLTKRKKKKDKQKKNQGQQRKLNLMQRRWQNNKKNLKKQFSEVSIQWLL